MTTSWIDPFAEGGTEPRPLRILARLLRIGAVLALVSLVLEFGFPVGRFVVALHAIDVLVVLVFVADALLRLLWAADRKAHARRHWIELLLVALLFLEGITAFAISQGSALTRLYIVGAQVYLLGAMLLRLARANERLTSRTVRPAWLLLGSFLVLIGLGTAFLLMPNSRAAGARPWSLMDALFTATSAACVTGLNVRDVGAHLSFRGQAVLLAIIQVGGLGLPTLAMLLTYLQQRAFRLRQMALTRDLLSVQVLGNLGKFLGYTLLITLACELLGALFLYISCRDPHLGGGPRAWWAAFHSVSAFCNAGFSLPSDSFVGYSDSWAVGLSLMFLIVAGGLGFPVLIELLRHARRVLSFGGRSRWIVGRAPVQPPPRLSLHSRLVLTTTGLLIVVGAILVLLSESGGALKGRGWGSVLLVPIFQSVTARTAGFNTVDIGALRFATLLVLMVLMVVGASPVSAGGGVKTSTFGVLGLTLRSMLRNREHVEAFGRTIPRTLVNASVAIILLYAMAAVVVTGLLAATQREMRFVDLLFESISALSTVGLSTGVTPRLNGFGQAVLCWAMLLGRVGPLVVLWSIVSRPPALRYEYPEEAVVVS